MLNNLKTLLPQEAVNFLNELIPTPPSSSGPVIPVDPLPVPVQHTQPTYYQQDVIGNQVGE